MARKDNRVTEYRTYEFKRNGGKDTGKVIKTVKLLSRRVDSADRDAHFQAMCDEMIAGALSGCYAEQKEN